jgi:hypothetical protein
MKFPLIAVTSRLIPAIAFFFVVGTANAQSIATAAVEKGLPAAVKCLGIQEDMVIFNVSYSNPTGSKFTVAIKDQEGNPLYQSVFNDKDFYKQFRLPKSDKSKITFVIRNGREMDIVRSFEINVNSRVVADIAIKKMN